MATDDTESEYYDFEHEHIQYVLKGGAPLDEAEFVVIGYHGKGGNDDRMFENLETTFADDPNVAYLAPASAKGEWFDDWIVPPDNPNLLAAMDSIDALVAQLASEGIDSSKIVLAGHSQGSTLVADYVARGNTGFHNVVLMSAPYNGIELSANQQNQIYANNLNNQPIRLTVHEFDPKFDVNTMEHTRQFFEDRGADADLTVHPGRVHLMTEEDHAVLDWTIKSTNGTPGADPIIGDEFDELIYGFAGNDVINSRGGNDTVLGGANDDTIDTQTGDDIVYGGRGNDHVMLGDGHDRAYLGAGNDTVFAGTGNDFVTLGRGSDTAYLGEGDDTLRVSVQDVWRSRNVVDGDGGFDTLQIVFDAKEGSTKMVVRELKALQNFIATAGPDDEYSPRALNATISGIEALDIVAPVVGNEDHGTTDEDTFLVLDVLANDRDILGDTANLRDSNDRLQIIGVDARRLPDGASLEISDDSRTLEFDPGTAFQTMAQGDTYTFQTNYTVADDQTNRVVVKFTIEVTGKNDAPVIAALDGNEAFLPGSGPLMADGSFLVSDVDRNDIVSASVVGVSASGGGVNQNLSSAELLGFLSLSTATPVVRSQAEGELGWTFDSSADDFDFLSSGNQSVIVYTVEVKDQLGAVDTEFVTITVQGGAAASAQLMAGSMPPPGDDYADESLQSDPSSSGGFDSLF